MAGGAAVRAGAEEHATPISPTRIKPAPRETRRIVTLRDLQTPPCILVFTGRRKKTDA
jgi:hypothetical protein